MTYEYTTESESRKMWHKLLSDLGFEKFARTCSVKLQNGVYTITVKEE